MDHASGEISLLGNLGRVDVGTHNVYGYYLKNLLWPDGRANVLPHGNDDVCGPMNMSFILSTQPKFPANGASVQVPDRNQSTQRLIEHPLREYRPNQHTPDRHPH